VLQPRKVWSKRSSKVVARLKEISDMDEDSEDEKE